MLMCFLPVVMIASCHHQCTSSCLACIFFPPCEFPMIMHKITPMNLFTCLFASLLLLQQVIAADDEDQALDDFYHTMGGTSWNNNTNWKSQVNRCQWYGITCDSLGHVTKLVLQTNALNGDLHACKNFTALQWLTVLSLDNNKITGTLPEAWNTMHNLKTMTLSYNSIQSGIPQSYSNMTALETIDLSHNQLTGTYICLMVVTDRRDAVRLVPFETH